MGPTRCIQVTMSRTRSRQRSTEAVVREFRAAEGRVMTPAKSNARMRRGLGKGGWARRGFKMRPPMGSRSVVAADGVSWDRRAALVGDRHEDP